MPSIPVTFTHEGKEYNATLTGNAPNAGTTVTLWHLMMDNSYYGQLIFTDNGWLFYAQSEGNKWLNELGDYFGNMVQLWYE